METKHGNLTVKRENSNIEITNGCVMIRLVMRDGGYSEEYYAVDSKGRMQLILSSLHKNIIPSSDHRTCSEPMISGNQSHLYGVCRESLRMVYSSAEITTHDKEKVAVLLSGSAMGHNVTCRIELRDMENSVHIIVEDSIDRSIRPPLVEYLMSSYAFIPAKWAVTVGNKIDYVWVPLLRPGDDQVIGDCTFHSPAAIIQHSNFAAALIPNLEMLKNNRKMQAALDLDAENGLLGAPLISYGFCGYEQADGHCFHDMTMAKRLDPPRLKYGFELMLDANCPKKSFHKRVARKLWNEYGGSERRLESGDRRLELGRIGDALLEPDAWATYGIYFQGNSVLKKGAAAVIDALLNAPKFDGLFPTKYDRSKHTWTGCDTSIDSAYYHTVECSRQCYWMLQWYRDVKDNEIILDFCKQYADFMIAHMSKSGEIAPWFDRQGRPQNIFNSDARTSASALFLARLGTITGIEKYTRAAERSIKCVIKKSIFQDHTLIDTTRHLSVMVRDPHTEALPLSGWALLWTAMACMGLYESVGDRRFVEKGASILDRLCLLQSIGDFFGTDSIPFGMLAKGNTCIEMDTDLTAQFAWCAMKYADVTGISEYFSRGSAALKAAVNFRGSSPIVSAHVATAQARVTQDYGSAFVHVGRKWALPVNGASVKRVSFERGKISLSLTGEEPCSERIVFGGIKGKSYRLQINGRKISTTSDEMKMGIVVR
jgi:hypothetical protein